jgi:hypothetical protein
VQPAHDVALGHDADEAAIVDDGERADIVRGELADQISDGGGGSHRRHDTALASQHVRDAHARTPDLVATDGSRVRTATALPEALRRR